MVSVLWVKMYRELWQKKVLVITLSLVLMIASGAYIGMSSVYQDMKMARDQYYLQYHHNYHHYHHYHFSAIRRASLHHPLDVFRYDVYCLGVIWLLLTTSSNTWFIEVRRFHGKIYNM